MRIGNMAIPSNRLGVCLEDTRKIYSQFGTEETDNEFVAHALDMNMRGGAFNQKMADLRSFGLINRKMGKSAVTELGEHATFGDELEKASAIERAFRNIPLWSNLLDKYGMSIDDSNFWVILAKITDANRSDAEKKANLVRKAYMDDVKYIKTVEKPVQPVKPQKQEPRAAEVVGRNEIKMETYAPSATASNYPFLGDPELGTPIVIKNVKTYKAAKLFWEDIAAYWESKIKEEEEKSKESEQQSTQGN